MTPAGRFREVLGIQLAAVGLLYLASLGGFLLLAGAVTERFTALATGPYLGRVIFAQLSVVPAYVVLALAATALVSPVLALLTRPGATRRRLALQVLGCDLLLLPVSALAFLWGTPGLVDSVARQAAPVAPRLDVYGLERLGVLGVAALAFGALVTFSLWRHLTALRAWRPRVFRAVLAVALVAVALPLGARAMRGPPPRATGKPGPLNVLVVAADSWRFDRLGVHGAARRDLTPNADAFAREAIDLTNLHVATASTLESWLTFLTGQFPPTHGVRSMYPSREEVAHAEASPSLLTRELVTKGYDTFISSDWVGNCFDLADFGFTKRHVGAVQNFEALLLEGTVRSHLLVSLYFGNPAGAWLVPGDGLAVTAKPEVLTQRLFDDIDDSVGRGRPFFGVLFASPTHLPYNARSPFNRRYVDPAYEGPHRYHVEVGAHELITSGFAPTLPPATIEHIRDLYDGAVADFDDTLGQMLAQLDARGLAGSTIVVVTSDHGEDLYDPGSTLGHGTNFFGGDQSTRIPFLVRVPAAGGYLRPGTQVDAIARNADFAPTVLELLGQPILPGMEGTSLVPLLKGEVDDLGLPAFAETCYLFFPKSKAMTGLTDAERAQVVELAGASDTLEPDPKFHDNLVLTPSMRGAVIAAKDRMVRTRRFKLVEIAGRTAPIRRLYDMAADPHQLVNLAGRGLPEEEQLSRLLEAYWRGDARGLRVGSVDGAPRHERVDVNVHVDVDVDVNEGAIGGHRLVPGAHVGGPTGAGPTR